MPTNKNAQLRYRILDIKFLSGGNSMPPIELLKLCGVDMSTAQPIREALAVFEELLEEYKTL